MNIAFDTTSHKGVNVGNKDMVRRKMAVRFAWACQDPRAMGNAELALLDRPELRIETDDIDAIYAEVRTRAPEILHPNSKTVQRKPWGAQKFAVLDSTTVCVAFRQW